MNPQKPEARVSGDGSTLDLHSIFYTLQGEGPFSGKRSVFIRLAGCNLQCPGCDTEYTKGRRQRHIDDIAILATSMAPFKDTLMVITGGEPLRQPIGRLVRELTERGYVVQIETNGVFAPDPLLVELIEYGWPVKLVVSPKTTRIAEMTGLLAHAFKYVISADSIDPNDGLPIKALEHPAATGVARPPKSFVGEVFINPFDAGDAERNKKNLDAASVSALRHGYRLGVQLHKIVGLD